MDLEIQKRIKEFAEKEGADNVVVVLGGADAELSGMAAETVVEGDPTYAGALANVALGLKVYHVAEPEFKALVDEAVFEEEVGMFEMTNDVEEISKEVSAFRK